MGFQSADRCDYLFLSSVWCRRLCGEVLAPIKSGGITLVGLWPRACWRGQDHGVSKLGVSVIALLVLTGGCVYAGGG